jgi:hypothetical protein
MTFSSSTPKLGKLPLAGHVGRPRRRPRTLIADRGYDHDKYRRLVWQRVSSRSSRAARPNMAPGSAATAGSTSLSQDLLGGSAREDWRRYRGG